MSKKAAGAKANITSNESAPAPKAPDPSLFRAPFKPRPKLFVGLFCLLVVWVGVLLTLYFTTVYPQRGKHLTPVVPAPGTQDPM